MLYNLYERNYTLDKYYLGEIAVTDMYNALESEISCTVWKWYSYSCFFFSLVLICVLATYIYIYIFLTPFYMYIIFLLSSLLSRYIIDYANISIPPIIPKRIATLSPLLTLAPLLSYFIFRIHCISFLCFNIINNYLWQPVCCSSLLLFMNN